MSWNFNWGNSSNTNSSNTNNNNNNNSSSWSFGNNTTSNNNTNQNPNKSWMIPQSSLPSGDISCLKCSPANDYVVVGTWNKEINVYQFSNNGSIKLMTSQKQDSPILSLAWDQTGSNIFVGGADNSIRLWNLQNNSFTMIGSHQSGVKNLAYCNDNNNLISTSWDGNICYWDMRSSQRIGSVNTQCKIYCMALRSPILVVGLSNRHVYAYDIRKPKDPFHNGESQLKHQIRTVDVFPNKQGFAVSGIEGRVGVENFNTNIKKTADFSFKCHRHQDSHALKSINNVYSINRLLFHPLGSFLTCGDDGEISIWDMLDRARIKCFDRLPLPIVDCDFDRTGQILVYGTGYTWYQGLTKYNANNKGNIYIHLMQRTDVQPKKSLPN